MLRSNWHIRPHQRRPPTQHACPPTYAEDLHLRHADEPSDTSRKGNWYKSIRFFEWDNVQVLPYLRNRCLAQKIACIWNGSQRNPTLGQMKGSHQWLEMLHRLKAYIASGFIFWKFLRGWFPLHIPIPRTGFGCLDFQAACDSIELWRGHSLSFFLKKCKCSEYLTCNLVHGALCWVRVV
jgi:hypothetical protein